MARSWVAIAATTLLIVTTSAINPNELKPCFERYDGFKIVGAMPFHSEWRMKAEEWCLEFCVRASRCASIVYDKQAHVCYFFSINGIEQEKMGKMPRMVYFQVTGRECAEKMQNKIEHDDYQRNIAYLQEQQRAIEKSSVSSTLASETTTAISKVETEPPLLLPQESGQLSSAEHTPADATSAEHSPHDARVAFFETPSRPLNVSDDEPSTGEAMTSRHKESGEDEFDGDPINFVRQFRFEKEMEEIERSASGLTRWKANQSAAAPILATSSSETPNVSVSLTSAQPIATEPPTTSTSTTTTTETPTTTETTTTTTTTTTTVPTTTESTSVLPTTTTTELPATSTLKSLMQAFKAVRRPLPVKTDVEEREKKRLLPFLTEVRRSPVRSSSALATAAAIAPFNVAFSDVLPPKESSSLLQPQPASIKHSILMTTTTSKPSRDDESLLTAPKQPIVDDCAENDQEIWLAVENSQVNSSSAATVVRRARQPLECMETCQALFVGDRPCDSFTYNEPAKRCIFHSSHDGFNVAPSSNNDFSTRAFRRFCYEVSLTPFSDCAEFLTFRDYTLDITPREVFDDLPSGNAGVAACIELCVLSNEFRCKSASINPKTGSCWIFDQHSLSRPANFKPSSDPQRLYFENGCIEMQITEDVLKKSKVQRIEPVLLDYRKLTKL